MAPRRCDRLAAVAPLLAALLATLPLSAQAAPLRFEAPDGTPFVLIADASVPQVHWAIASPLDVADEPPGFEGLAWTTLRMSLFGTWTFGSLDVAKERDALAQLDAAWQQLLREPGDPKGLDTLRQRDERATALADLTAFPRVLATAPAYQPEVLQRGSAGVFVLTTLPRAIGDVARLLVDRRDQQALRELPRTWLTTYTERSRLFALDRARAVHAEVIALSMPDHPASRIAEPPSSAAPQRAQAQAVWNATQRPERTVHVLVGDFDANAVKTVLVEAFGKCSLPPAPPPRAATLRPLAGARRSTVNGVATPTLAIGWILPAVDDRFALAAALQWLAGGSDSVLGRELQRLGRTGAEVRATAPWPGGLDGAGLFMLEVRDPGGVNGLADTLLAACRAAAAKLPDAESLQTVNAGLQREWRQRNREPRLAIVEAAAQALYWPRQPVVVEWPEQIDGKAVQAVLARTFAGHPAIVEGTP